MTPSLQPRHPGAKAPALHQCELCNKPRSAGGSLVGVRGVILWVCEDCQHQLARGLDDSGALGG